METLKILHSADIQVKNRNENLWRSSNNMLLNIEKEVINQKADILILAGDLFEYATPNDSERKLIYNFLSRLLNIETLKEIVLVAGNHDIEKEKKKLYDEFNLSSNALSIFSEMLNHLDSKKSLKLSYHSKSGVYNSSVSDKIKFVVYSFEDDFKLSIEDKHFIAENNQFFYISIYHDMVKEYIDESKLPIRKDIYNGLLGMSDFIPNTLICAGDIHIAWEHYKEETRQLFIYPGSPMQHTHSEGRYITIGESVITKCGNQRSIKKYEFLLSNDYESFDILKALKSNDIILNDFVVYLTIELDSAIPYDIIKHNLSNLEAYYGLTQTFVKIKSSNLFVEKEKEIFDIVQEIYKDCKRVKIDFEYSKLVQLNTYKENPIIQSIIEEKLQTSKGNTLAENDGVLTSENIDNLLLNSEQLGKMFGSVLDDILLTIKNDVDSDITIEQLKEEILSLFFEQLDSSQEKSSKRYNITLTNIETNGFMAIAENKIFLDIPGVTRILGTNGIGKTTLYNMIRWFITSKIYDSMQDNTVVKNNLDVFNKKLIDVDEVFVKLTFNINQNKIIGTRKVVRKWKNNVTDVQKSDLNWKEYVAGLDREFELQIFAEDISEPRIVKGEQAEKAIIMWFGDTIKNILFLNQAKIESLLKTNSSALNEMILNFIGVDYLKKMEDNLDILKTKYNLAKPKRNKEDIRNSIIDSKIFIKQKEEAIEQIENKNQLLLADKKLKDSEYEKLNQDLINIGNIPNQIATNKEKIKDVQTSIDSFEFKEVKTLIPFDVKQPEKDEAFIAVLNDSISNGQKDLLIVNEKEKQQAQLLADFSTDDVLNKINADYKNYKEKLELKLTDFNNKKSGLFNELLNDVISIQTKLEEKLNEKKGELTITSNDIQQYNKQILILKNELISGVCETCKRPFDDDFEEHKVDIQQKIDSNNKRIEILEPIKLELENKIKLIQSVIETYKTYRDAINKQLIPNGCKEAEKYVEQILVVTSEIDLCHDNLTAEKTENDLFQKVAHIRFGDYSICENLIRNQTLYNILGLINQHKELRSFIDQTKDEIKKCQEYIDTKKDILSVYNKDFNDKLVSYQTLLNKNIADNKSIQEHNDSVQSHNLKHTEYERDINRLKVELIDLEKILPAYDIINTQKAELSKIINDIEQLYADKEKDKKALEIGKVTWENEKTKFEAEYQAYIDYLKNNLIWKVYSKLIKSNFKEIVFDYYRNFLNNTLNYLLQDVNFKLFWNNDSDLYMTDFKNGKLSYQPVTFSSGMEICFLGLSLIYTIHLLNVKNTISHIFIDEISGTLNDGKGLSTEEENYKELMVQIISKFKNKSVFIIDHSIDNLYETVTYEVVRGDRGSKYIQK